MTSAGPGLRSPSDANGDAVEILYDAECPVCDAYCSLSDVRAGEGSISRVNARTDSALLQEATARRLDVDEGMIVRYRGDLYHGADAIHILARLNPRKTLFDKISHRAFRSRRRARFLYPALRLGRSLLLRLLGRTKIGNLKAPR